jgi:hypothetical protein
VLAYKLVSKLWRCRIFVSHRSWLIDWNLSGFLWLITCNLMSGDNFFHYYGGGFFLEIKITIDIKRSTVLVPLLLYPYLTYLGKSTFSPFLQSRSVFLHDRFNHGSRTEAPSSLLGCALQLNSTYAAVHLTAHRGIYYLHVEQFVFVFVFLFFVAWGGRGKCEGG